VFTGGLIGVAFVGVVVAPNVVPQVIYLHDLATSNRMTQRKLVEVYPQLHSACRYGYRADKRYYEKHGDGCGYYDVGQQVKVYFSPLDPGKSLNRNQAAAFQNDVMFFVVVLLFAPAFLAAGFYIRLRRTGRRIMGWPAR